MITQDEFQKSLKIVFEYQSQMEQDFKEVKDKVNNIKNIIKLTPETTLVDSGCSSRLRNLIIRYSERFDIQYSISNIILKDLSKIRISEFSKCNQVGKNSVEELRELCFYAGVSLLN